MYILPIRAITSILGGCPWFWPEILGQYRNGYRNGCRNGTHCYKHDLASADSSSGAVDCCPMYFVNSWTPEVEGSAACDLLLLIFNMVLLKIL